MTYERAWYQERSPIRDDTSQQSLLHNNCPILALLLNPPPPHTHLVLGSPSVCPSVLSSQSKKEIYYQIEISSYSTHNIFKEIELVGKFFKRATKNWKMFCDHALQTHIQSRLRLLHVDNFQIILSLQKQLNL